MANPPDMYDVVKALAKLTFEHQGLARPHSAGMTPLQWVQEYCTIRVGGPRGIGHTSAMLRLGREETSTDILLVTPYARFIRETRHEVRGNKRCRVVSAQCSNFLEEVGGLEFFVVVVDTAGQVPQDRIEAAQKFLASHTKVGDAALFIVLG